MLFTSVVTNTWKCDGLSCPTANVESEINPFIRIVLSDPSVPQTIPCEIDLCPVCITTLTAPDVVTWVASLQVG